LGFGAKILAYSIASLGSQAFRLEWTTAWLSQADHESSQPSGSHEPVLHNKSLSVYLYISDWLWFSVEPQLIHAVWFYLLHCCSTITPSLFMQFKTRTLDWDCPGDVTYMKYSC
jgi:hypothetical protein